ncbi:MAG TPA: TonB-dependent receptor [Kofleriaceae bacterium]|nr:TonB-dependent receptor [Kofleriaceae bacterium]
MAVICVLGGGVADAQPMSVHGRVVDGSGKAVRGATVSIEGSTDGVKTDGDGRYSITAEPGASLLVIADGFGAGLGSAGEDIVLDAEASETIQVKGEKPSQQPGAATLDREQLERIPGAGNDVMRAMSAMPGVASYPLPLGQSGIVIRGSSPQDSKILVDDFEVPMLYHYLGFRSIVPSESIDTLEYVPGGFDVQYGRATSGIVSLTTRAGDAKRGQQFETSAGELGVLGQGSFDRERGHYMIAFRRSAIDLLLPLMIPSDLDLAMTTVPRFYDEQLRIDYALSTKWTLRLSSLGSDDAMELYASRDMNADKRFLNRGRFMRMTATAGYHEGPLTAKLSVSGIAEQSMFERGEYQHLHVGTPALTTRAEVARSAEHHAGLRDVSWRTGVEMVSTRHTIDVAAPREHREGEPPAPDDPMDTSTQYKGAVDTSNVAGWTSVSAALDARVTFSAGLRVDAYTRADDLAIQPRGDVTVKLTQRLSVRTSAGGYSRPAEYQTELLDPTLKAERSHQMMTGLLHEPVEGMRLQGSVYATQRTNLITRDAMTGELANTGRGSTYGAEVLGTYNRGPWFGWLAYSYSHSTRVDAPGQTRRLFDYDQPHSLNLAASYRFGRWQLGGRFRLHSGLPTTPVVAATYDSDANLYDPVYGAVNSERAPMHHQLDLRIDRATHWGPVKITQFLDVQNVYMNETVVGYFYGFDYTQRAAFRALPILPTAGLRGEF